MLVEDPVFSGDIQECSNSEVQKHPVSRNQYPESANTGNGFRYNVLSQTHNFIQGLDWPTNCAPLGSRFHLYTFSPDQVS